MPGGEVRLVELVKYFDDVAAVAGIDLLIPGGEFFSLLGPSGCGKTTTLRLVAGFEQPTSGQILLDGVDMAHTPAHKRQVNTVFQSYALFPHLDVAGNVAFGLRFQDVTKAEEKQRVARVLELVRLQTYGKRRVSQLSGGQQQRVALARALILNPAVLLLDEPLGALDAKLRKDLQVELKAIQEEVGITFLYVTHDQEEALSMSDRLAVMSDGRIEQVGVPRTVYEHPASSFVADFLGVSNQMAATASPAGPDRSRVRLGEFDLEAGQGDVAVSGAVKLVIRPERIRVAPFDETGPNRLPAMIERLVYLGPGTQVFLRLSDGTSLQALSQSEGTDYPHEPGSPVSVFLPADALRVLATPAEPLAS